VGDQLQPDKLGGQQARRPVRHALVVVDGVAAIDVDGAVGRDLGVRQAERPW